MLMLVLLGLLRRLRAADPRRRRLGAATTWQRRATDGTRTLISPRPAQPAGAARRIYWTVLIAVVVVFTLVFLGPLYWMVTGALKTGQEIAQIPPTLFPQHPTLDATTTTRGTCSTSAKLLFNTALLRASARWLFQLVFDVAAAYALSKLRPVFGNVILGADAGHADDPGDGADHPAVRDRRSTCRSCTSTCSTRPWAIWLPAVANALQHLPAQAVLRLDPATSCWRPPRSTAPAPLRTLWSIILPMSRPILGVVSIFAVVAVWKDFLWPLLVMPRPENQTVSVGIYAFAGGSPQNVVIAALGHRRDPDHHLLPDLPAQHHVRPHRGSLKG